MAITDLLRFKEKAVSGSPSATPAGLTAQLQWLEEISNGGRISLFRSSYDFAEGSWCCRVEIKGRVVGVIAEVESGWSRGARDAVEDCCRKVREVLRG